MMERVEAAAARLVDALEEHGATEALIRKREDGWDVTVRMTIRPEEIVIQVIRP